MNMSKKNRIANVTPVAPVTTPTSTTTVDAVPSVNGTHTPTVDAVVSEPTTTVETGLGDGGSINDTPTTSEQVANTTSTTNGNDNFNLTAAIRNTLTELGLDATSTDVMMYLKDRYGKNESDINKGTFNNTLSVQRSKMKNGNTGLTKTSSTLPNHVEMSDVVSLCGTLNVNLTRLGEILDAIENTGSIMGIRNALGKMEEMVKLSEMIRNIK